MNDLAALQALGLTLPSPAFLAGAILFGLVGMWAWASGRRRALPGRKWLGLVLCFFPYLVPATAWMWAVGLALCASLVWWRE